MTTYLHIGVYLAYFHSYLVISLLRQSTGNSDFRWIKFRNIHRSSD